MDVRNVVSWHSNSDGIPSAGQQVCSPFRPLLLLTYRLHARGHLSDKMRTLGRSFCQSSDVIRLERRKVEPLPIGLRFQTKPTAKPMMPVIHRRTHPVSAHRIEIEAQMDGSLSTVQGWGGPISPHPTIHPLPGLALVACGAAQSFCGGDKICDAAPIFFFSLAQLRPPPTALGRKKKIPAPTQVR